MTNEKLEVVKLVQDYVAAVEVEVTLEDFNQTVKALEESDLILMDAGGVNDECDGLNSIIIKYEDGKSERVDLFEPTITKCENSDSVLSGHFTMEFDENDTDIDGALKKVQGKFEGASVEPFMVSYSDMPADAEVIDGGTEDEIEYYIKGFEPVNVKFNITLADNYNPRK